MNKTMKLFSGADILESVEKAVAYFKCAEAELYTAVLVEGNELREFLVFAMHIGDRAVDTKNLNGDFNLLYEDDGVYFELYPATGYGLSVDKDEVSLYIKRKDIASLNTEAVLNTLSAGFGRVKVAAPQQEVVLNEDIAVTLSADEMEASCVLLPPDEGGADISINEISDKLRQAGVVYGLSILNIRQLVKDKIYGKPYVIATGTLPVHGDDGKLTYHFDTGIKTGLPVEDAAGTVDYRNLSLFEPVKQGQLLITRTLPTGGKPGSTVRGNELKPRPGRDVNLPRTKNVSINEDKTAVYASVSGMVRITDGVVAVADVYKIDGDCDLSTGNINFDGNIVITGSVITGMVVKASGNITVGGVVNDAELIAGGNVELTRGIQGVDKGRITAGGSVTASFLERAFISAGIDITADVIMHCTLEAGHFLILTGKRGSIMGGHARIGKEVRSKTIGGSSHVQTDIEVGLMPKKAARLEFLKKEVERLSQEKAKIEQLELYLSKAANLDEEKRAALAKSIMDTRGQSAQLLTEYSDEYSRLEYEAEHAIDGKIHCTSTTYPGAKITIGKGIYKVTEQVSYATFKYREGEVVFTSCEINAT